MNHKKPNDASVADHAQTERAEENNASVWDGEDILIYSYSRAQALEDGVLVDAGKLAEEAGFRFPVALTHAAWETCVRVSADSADQDETGRLWDVLMCLRCATRTGSGSEACFDVLIRQSETKLTRVALKAVCSPGDDPEPVITIMLPDED